MKCKLRENEVLTSKYGIVIPKPMVEQQSAKFLLWSEGQGICRPNNYIGVCVTGEPREGSKQKIEAGIIRERCVEERDLPGDLKDK